MSGRKNLEREDEQPVLEKKIKKETKFRCEDGGQSTDREDLH